MDDLSIRLACVTCQCFTVDKSWRESALSKSLIAIYTYEQLMSPTFKLERLTNVAFGIVPVSYKTTDDRCRRTHANAPDLHIVGVVRQRPESSLEQLRGALHTANPLRR